MKVEQENKMRN